ncbi:MAG: leukocidin family pore-forming toxin [Endozoicomonadaceae bacterium]|nr:leukocidin family pore-forming toxin [Endozoicomonadaceae bacterium]
MALPKHFNRLGSLSVAGLQLFTLLPAFAHEMTDDHLSEAIIQAEAIIQTSFAAKGYGESTAYFSVLQQKLRSNDMLLHAAALGNRLIYINAKFSLTPDQEEEIRENLSSDYIVMIDSTESTDKEATKKLSAALGGIGFDSPVILIRKTSDGIPEYKELIPYDKKNDDTIALNISEPSINYEKLASETSSMLKAWKKPQQRNRANKSINQYSPEISIPVELRHTGFPCMVGASFDGNGITGNQYWHKEMVDACDNDASVSLFYTVDLVRSVASTVGGSSDDAKYIRITIDPASNGGSGWHLADRPTHKHTWYQSWANRITWFAPVADGYAVSINSNDPDVHLYNTIPSSYPKESNISDSSSIQIGVTGGPNILDPSKMKGKNLAGFSGVNLGMTFSIGSERSINYRNHEYELSNLSRAGKGDTASWLWSREFHRYAEFWRTRTTGLLWCGDWFYDDHFFSAIAYSNFTPGFSATFYVPGDKSDVSTIEFESSINAVALGGRVQYLGVHQSYGPAGFKGTKYSVKQDITINWGSSFFNAEIPVSIEAYKEDSVHGICLEVLNSNSNAGSAVGVGQCNFKQNQIWGMDSEYRYRSFLAQDRCLTRENHDTLTIQPCDHAANQKWQWEDEYLLSSQGGALTIQEYGRLSSCQHTEAPTVWRNFIRRAEIAGTMTVSSPSITAEPVDQSMEPTLGHFSKKQPGAETKMRVNTVKLPVTDISEELPADISEELSADRTEEWFNIDQRGVLEVDVSEEAIDVSSAEEDPALYPQS